MRYELNFFIFPLHETFSSGKMYDNTLLYSYML